jgi:hypothetical protein
MGSPRLSLKRIGRANCLISVTSRASLGRARIRAKGYTDNVPDLTVWNFRQLPDAAQAAIDQLACLGNVVEISTLRLVLRKSERKRDPHTALRGRPGADGSQT